MDDPSLRIPDAIEPISAYRAWVYSIEGRKAQLFPLSGPPIPSRSQTWEGAGTNWVTASCSLPVASTHEVPSEDCSCGFYSLKELDLAVDLAGVRQLWSTHGLGRGGVVLGRILLSGKVIEHESGYRAERARIAELIPLGGTERSVMVLAHRLGVGMAPAVEPRTQEELDDLVHPTLAALRRRTEAPKRRIEAPPDPVRTLEIAAIAIVGLVVASIMALAGSQPPAPLVIWPVILLGRYGHSIGKAYRDWRHSHESDGDRPIPLPPVPPAAA